MAAPLSRSWYDTLIDDDGSGTVGTIWNKMQVDGLLDTVDASLATLIDTSGQIPFPSTQNPSTNPTTLDDYREGTWTPVWLGTDGQSGQVYSVQDGHYIKTGRRCEGSGRIALSIAGTFSGELRLGGLPFVTANIVCAGILQFVSGGNFGSTFSWLGGFAETNATTFFCKKIGAGGANGYSNMIASDAGGADLSFVFSYITAT